MRKPLLTAALLVSVALPAWAQTQAPNASAVPAAPQAQPDAATPVPASAAPETPAAEQSVADIPEPPEAFRGAPDLEYRGMTGGIDYWHFAGSDYLIGQNRSDGTITIGYLFEPTGQDVSAVITGAEPLSLEDFRKPSADAEGEMDFSEEIPPLEEDVALTPLVPEPGIAQNDNQLLENAPESVRNELLAELVEALDKAETRDQYEIALLAWREKVRNTLGQQPAPALPQEILNMLKTDAEAQPEAGTQAQPEAEAKTEAAAPAAEAKDQAAPADPLLEFRPTLSPSSEQMSVDDIPAEALSPFSLATPDAPQTQATEQAEAEASEAPEAAPTVTLPQDLSLEAGGVSPADMGQMIGDVADQLAFETLSQRSRWFALGAPGAPVVYAVIDPTCPFCSRALADLKDDVLGGDIQLRVVMAPLLSPKSEETIAGIMLSDAPGQVLFSNAEARSGRGGEPVQPRNATDLPEDVRNDLAVNRQNIIDLGVNQIPYFAWQTADGLRTAAGVPSDGQFADALPQPESQAQ